MGATLRSQTVSTQLEQIAEQAVDYPEMVFTTLAHKIDVNFLREAYHGIRKNAAPGFDNMTAKEYALDLEENLVNLHERLRKGRYIAPPVERVWIEKENGKDRPIGKPTFEDKIVQKSVEMLMSAIYDQAFYDFSHGFRKGHSQHQAIHEVHEQCRGLNIKCIVSADITGLFDNIDHSILRNIIQKKVNDGGILRLIGKWLNAGVVEEERITYPDKGTPQGGVISPLLSNIFLHYVLDEWFVKEVKPRMKGRCFISRWADDFIIGFECETDAQRVISVLPKRFKRVGLTLHPDKTRMISFGKPHSLKEVNKGNRTFDYLGFTFYWSKSRQGYWVIKKKTARKRLNRFMQMLWSWCKENRHKPIRAQHDMLRIKLRGFYQYFGVRSNYKSLEVVYEYAEKAWRHWLSRRSHTGNVMFDELRKGFPLPLPIIVHNI
jgi:group II intron reverse transcriptase/maturase